MKTLPLALVVSMVSMGLFGIGCGSEPEEEGPPAETEVARIASSLERKLAVPIAIPADSGIGAALEDLVEARAATLTAQPIVNMGSTGQRCTVVRYLDDKNVEQMRRDRCTSDKLRIGKVLYTDENRDGKVDQVTDSTTGTYDLFDDDFDGKADRMIESAERVATPPIALTDFAPNVTITAGGTIASRARQDKDHDGKFDVESVTATTAFRIVTPVTTGEPTP